MSLMQVADVIQGTKSGQQLSKASLLPTAVKSGNRGGSCGEPGVKAMSEIADSIRNRISRREWFTRAEIDSYTATNDLELWSAVYCAITETHCRIHPVPAVTERWSFILKYLMRCIREDPSSDYVHSGYEAADHLACWLKSCASDLPGNGSAIELAERELAAAWTAGDQAVRDRLVNGVLEHALEKAAVRPFFAHWEKDPSLKGAWKLAMSWATTRGE